MLAWLALSFLVACANEGTPAAPAAPVGGGAAAAAPVATHAPAGDLAPTSVVASWDGGELTYEPVQAEIGNQLIKLEADFLSQRYDTQEQEVQAQADKAILLAEAKKRGMADELALLKVEVDGKVDAPTDAELQEAYQQLARRLGGRSFDEVKAQVAQAVTQKKQAERYGAYIEDLRKTYNVKVKLPFPDLPRFPVSVDDDPFEGPAEAPITIVQFAEYQCPYCGKADQTLRQLMKDYDGKIKLVFRDFPLGFHEYAIPAAVAANCAEPQGKYWEMHRIFMSNQRSLTDADLEKAAQEVGLNTSDWQACRKDPKREAEVRKDMEDGAALGVQGTPAFFINGVFLNGAQPYEKFKAIIDRELASRAG